jgi:dolichol kinase
LATAKFSGSPSLSADWRRRIRTFRRGIAVLSAYRDLLAPRHGRVALALWGHKATRFTAPFAAGAGLVATALLTPRSDLAAALLAIELVAIGSGVAALAVPALGRLRVARLSGFFLMMNAAAAVAWFHHLSGRTAVIWEPTNRAA